ncbi:MAG: hypothetical protein R2713_15265 [Ilumatobacteraceae bacterium]
MRARYMLAKALLLTGQAERSLHYADSCLDGCVEHRLADFDLAYAHEARARALAALGRDDESLTAWRAAKAVPSRRPGGRRDRRRRLRRRADRRVSRRAPARPKPSGVRSLVVPGCRDGRCRIVCRRDLHQRAHRRRRRGVRPWPTAWMRWPAPSRDGSGSSRPGVTTGWASR